MNMYQDALESGKKFVIWGCGNYLGQIIDRIDPGIEIMCVCDSDEKKWGTVATNRNLKCVAPYVLEHLENIVVLIAVKNRMIIRDIQKKLDIQGIPNCHINDAIKEYRAKYEAFQIEKYNQTIGQLCEPKDEDVLKCFISVSVPVQACQLRCRYCYIGQNGGFENDEIVMPSAGFIRKALSRKRLGGTALINFCGSGETLLCNELFLIICELVEEGHYISIITNALLTKEIERYLQIPFHLRKKLFFKCSFHYEQLKKNNALELYARNVNRIWESGASISVEMVPEDELVPLIPEIRKFCLEHFGALPHITVARDESKNGMPIITEYSDEQYRKIWGQFESSMFMFKMDQMNKITEYCTAGKSTFLFSLAYGDISPCPQESPFFNIYEDISQKIDYREVGYACSNPYCRNGHAYLTFGIVETIDCCSYLQMRDRTTIEGNHWVSEDMAVIFKQRICDNWKESSEHSV